VKICRKLSRWRDILLTLLSLPILLVLGLFGGLCIGAIGWWTKLKLVWSMRDSTYVWEEDD